MSHSPFPFLFFLSQAAPVERASQASVVSAAVSASLASARAAAALADGTTLTLFDSSGERTPELDRELAAAAAARHGRTLPAEATLTTTAHEGWSWGPVPSPLSRFSPSSRTPSVTGDSGTSDGERLWCCLCRLRRNWHRSFVLCYIHIIPSRSFSGEGWSPSAEIQCPKSSCAPLFCNSFGKERGAAH